VPQLGPPVRALLELAPVKITRINGLYLVDLGQNMVGHVRLTAKGPAGTVIVLQHAETLNADGTIYNENLRQAIALDRFVLKGDAAGETFEPRFTFHGFRYVQIAGYPGELTKEAVRGSWWGATRPRRGRLTLRARTSTGYGRTSAGAAGEFHIGADGLPAA